MKVKKEFKKISVEKDVHNALKMDRDYLQDTKGGRWTISDTIRYYFQLFKKMR